MAKNTLEQKFKDDPMRGIRIRNAHLVCKNCLFRLDDRKVWGNTSRCEKLEVKPDSIMYGGKCELYVKE